MKKEKIYIPARFKSKRFPGKLLKIVSGKPMLLTITKKVEKIGFLPTIVTGDKIIINFAKKYKINYLKSKNKHISGMSRVCEATKNNNSTIIYILFGDELYLPEKYIRKFVKYVKSQKKNNCWHLLTKIKKIDKNDRNVVKCALNKKNEIIDFTRKYKKKYDYKCVGLFAFKKKILSKYDKLNKSKKESSMKVEQFKLIENNIKINTLVINKIQNSINSKKDLKV